MSDSDSETDLDFGTMLMQDLMAAQKLARDKASCANIPVKKIFDHWCHIPDDTRKECAQQMNVCQFWLPILLLPDKDSSVAAWALEIGLLDPKGNVTMKHLHRINTVEAIFRGLAIGSLNRDQAIRVFWLSNQLNLHSPDVVDEALEWLEMMGECEIRQRVLHFDNKKLRFIAFQLLFTEFSKYIEEMCTDFEKTKRTLMARPSPEDMENCEQMKIKGNINFKKEKYEEAVKFYSIAVRFYPDNHIVYGNRALCYIKCEEYLKAVVDGKRAVLIKPCWAKGHYRYCEALFCLGELKLAFEANTLARNLCKDHQEGIRDLEQQFQKFKNAARLWYTKGEHPKKATPKKTASKRPESTNGPTAAEPRPQAAKTAKTNKSELAPSKAGQTKADRKPVKSEKAAAAGGAKDSKPTKSEVKTESKKNKTTTLPAESQKAALCSELRSAVQDAHTALTNQRSHNAEQAFSQALSLLGTSRPTELGLSTVDVLLLLYGRASALTEIGQPEELAEAQRLVEKMKLFEERTFQCLVLLAVGRVFVKENRFSVALRQFSDSLQIVKNQITPGKLTWPLTKEVVKETQPEHLKQILQSFIDLCKFPPEPDAVCRLQTSRGHSKSQIYIKDPDFKGFIQICCCQSCTVEYHMTCWKNLKTSSFSEKNEKDFLHDPCLTPDCVGQICSIKIYGPTGLVKCKFDVAVSKVQRGKKPKVNQECTSQKKLKSKVERRLKRKQRPRSFQETRSANEDGLQKEEEEEEEEEPQTQQKAWLLYRDRVLLQISQNVELLREETRLQLAALGGALRPWVLLDSQRGNQIAVTMVYWEELQGVGRVLDLLLERKNRVWARVLVQLLSSCVDINPKLYTWACHLNNAGLDAARSFIQRYAAHLEQQDWSILLGFKPLEELIAERLGSKAELLSSVTEFIKQAPPQDMRLFIWALEEHRDQYASCHSILDEYFDMMDGHCSILKKSDENPNNSPMKSRGRKKKQRENRREGAYYSSALRAATPVDEGDQDFYDDESLSFLHPGDSFAVPDHLREQVADFEDQYNNSRHRGLFDNSSDPTKDSLYDYFAQILEEHGPLSTEDPLLVGELGNFPPVAQQTLGEAGGLEPFLLGSHGFLKLGRTIGLAQHAALLQPARPGPSLDDLDDITDPTAAGPALNGLSVQAPEFYPSYAFSSLPPGPDADGELYCRWSHGDGPQQDAGFLSDDLGEPDLGEPDLGEPDLYTSGPEDLLFDPAPLASGATDRDFVKKPAAAAVQVSPENTRSVAVNTEIHEPFESCPGDINKKQRSNAELEEQVKKMAAGCEKTKLGHVEELAGLEEEVQKINVNIQVTNKELLLFQEKLEEEVRKDQREKKANQEVLRSLKGEMEELLEEQGRLTRNIREKKNKYESKLSDFLELSNQSAAEKMSLEDEIQRCKALLSSATRRSAAAQLWQLESSRDGALSHLHRELANATALLSKLDEAVLRHPNLETARSSCRANVQEMEKMMSATEARYQERVDQVKNGGRVGELLSVDERPAAAAAAAAPPADADADAAPAAPASRSPLLAEATHKAEPHGTVFDKAMEHLATMFPDCSRSDLKRFVQELRSISGGSLNGKTLQEVVGGVTQLILDQQENVSSANMLGRGSPANCATPPPVTTAWQTTGAQKATRTNALNVEDPCIICHDDMSPDDICVLECRHSFHDKCIRSWLTEKRTCPTCRKHALLPDDFPALCSRRRL